MAMQEPQAEPSMEEILASIRRIISEEDQQPEARAPSEPVLELTEPAEDHDIVAFEEEAAPQPAPPPAQTPPPAAPPVSVIAPVAAMAAAPVPPAVSPREDESLVGDRAVSAAAGAFTRLAGSVRIADAPGQTLEGMIRELVRPMLKDWLDANLAAIVEAKVEAELDRISRLAR